MADFEISNFSGHVQALAIAADQNGDMKLDAAEKVIFNNLLRETGLTNSDEFKAEVKRTNAIDDECIKTGGNVEKQNKKAHKAQEQKYETAFGKDEYKKYKEAIAQKENDTNRRVGKAFKELSKSVPVDVLSDMLADRPDVANYTDRATYMQALDDWARTFEDYKDQTIIDHVDNGFKEQKELIEDEFGKMHESLFEAKTEVLQVLEKDLEKIQTMINDGTAIVLNEIRTSSGAIIKQIKTSEGNIIEAVYEDGNLTRAVIDARADGIEGTVVHYGEANLAKTDKAAQDTQSVNASVARVNAGLENYPHLGPNKNAIQTLCNDIASSDLPASEKTRLLDKLGDLANDVNIYPREINAIRGEFDRARRH